MDSPLAAVGAPKLRPRLLREFGAEAFSRVGAVIHPRGASDTDGLCRAQESKDGRNDTACKKNYPSIQNAPFCVWYFFPDFL